MSAFGETVGHLSGGSAAVASSPPSSAKPCWSAGCHSPPVTSSDMEAAVSVAGHDLAPGMICHSQVKAIATTVAERFGSTAPVPSTWDDPAFWNVESDRTARCQFLAVGNAINFRFWELHDHEAAPAVGTIDGETFRGSLYMWRRLRTRVLTGAFSLDPHFLAEMTVETFQAAFEDDAGHFPLRAAVADRVENLRDLGARLLEDWCGYFVEVVDAARGSLDRFAKLSCGFRAYDDPVQKLTMVNAIMLTGSGLATFDREPLPGADYHLIKQAVRQGLVEPTSQVARKLATGELLDEEESLPLRRAVLDSLVEVGEISGVSTAVLDNLYWLNRRICSDHNPACRSGVVECPFESVCKQRTGFGLPMELTRYY